MSEKETRSAAGEDLDIDQALADLETIKVGGSFPGRGEQLAPEAESQWSVKSIFVLEMQSEKQLDAFRNELWDCYSYGPNSPALVGRAYSDPEHLLRTWAGDGVCLLLVKSLRNEQTGEFRDIMMAVGSLADMDRVGRNAELRYQLDPDQAGGGVQKLAISSFSAWANQRLGIERLYLRAFADDEVTIEILTKKFGWEKCGDIPEYGYRNGEQVNAVLLTAGLDVLQKCVREANGGTQRKQQGDGNSQEVRKQPGL